jgi:hypothetical protein
MKNVINIRGVRVVNLADHQVKIKDGDKVLVFGKNPEPKPEVESIYVKVDGTPIDAYRQEYIGIKNLPDPQEDTIYIVPLFVVNCLVKLEELGRLEERTDIFSPGKKCYGLKGVKYAKGLRAKGKK